MTRKVLPRYSIGLAIFLLALGIRLLYWQFIGVKLGSDSTRYTEAAEAIIQAHGNPTALINMGQPYYFWLYPIVLALLGNVAALVVVFQIFLQSLAAVLLYKAGKLLFNPTTGIVAGFFYVVFWELFQWDVYILTDSIFLFLVVALLYCYVLLVTKGLKKHGWLMAILLIACILERPHGLVVSLVFWVALLLRLPRRQQVLFGIMSVIAVVLYVSRLSDNSVIQNVDVYHGVVSKFYAEGVVIDGRPAYNIATDSTILGMIKIFLHRSLAFWFVYPIEFSLGHKILNILFLVPLYIFGLFGVVKFWKKEDESKRYYISFFVLFIVIYASATSLTNVDYDWRLRLPVWPFVIVLASAGFSTLIARFPFWRKLLSSSEKKAR
jgi:4-amino-4-deoxy-L-arabinose transferase-like glycosyltransferase